MISCVSVHGKSVAEGKKAVSEGFIAEIVNGTSVPLNNRTVLKDVLSDGECG